jgi:hydrogenase expression/formation protein HypE
MVKATTIDFTGLSCPIPISEYPHVLMAHGGGGKLTQQLIRKIFLPQFANELLQPLHDGAMFAVDGTRLAFSTDSYVISPIFFPGGSIGELAVNGTVNDLSMCGAVPLYLSSGFIIEEGLPMDDLWKIVVSMKAAADRAGVTLVTGDTKVVDRGKGDKVFINTSGLGRIPDGVDIHPRRATPGDAIVLSGRIAEHGIAILSVREGLEFQTQLQSDCAPLNGLVQTMLSVCPDIHVLRDPTRGGVASVLNEIAEDARVGMLIDQGKIPLGEEVRGACEMLGLDPLYVANEGKLIAVVPFASSDRVVHAMRQHELGVDAAVIGQVTAEHPGIVAMRTTVGGTRVVDMIAGEQLPRIC